MIHGTVPKTKEVKNKNSCLFNSTNVEIGWNSSPTYDETP